MTTEQKLKDLETWAEGVRVGKTPEAETFQHPALVATAAKRIAAALFGVSVEQIESKTRTESVAWARQVAMVMTRRISNCSLEEVGRLFGKDHGTVIYAEQAIEDRIHTAKRFQQQTELAEQKLREIFESK